MALVQWATLSPSPYPRTYMFPKDSLTVLFLPERYVSTYLFSQVHGYRLQLEDPVSILAWVCN